MEASKSKIVVHAKVVAAKSVIGVQPKVKAGKSIDWVHVKAGKNVAGVQIVRQEYSQCPAKGQVVISICIAILLGEGSRAGAPPTTGLWPLQPGHGCGQHESQVDEKSEGMANRDDLISLPPPASPLFLPSQLVFC